jgi:hypothetical protein
MSRPSEDQLLSSTVPSSIHQGAESCPATPDEVLRHVRSHVTGSQRLGARQLEFVRTAQLEDRRYWVWRFPVRGAAGYALVMEDEEGTWLSAQTAPKSLAVDHLIEADLKLWLDGDSESTH